MWIRWNNYSLYLEQMKGRLSNLGLCFAWTPQTSLFTDKACSNLADGWRCHTYKCLQPPLSILPVQRSEGIPERESLHPDPYMVDDWQTPERSTRLSRETTALPCTLSCTLLHNTSPTQGQESSGTFPVVEISLSCWNPLGCVHVYLDLDSEETSQNRLPLRNMEFGIT